LENVLEILESDIGKSIRNEDYVKQAIRPINNTPDEITALVVEMDACIKGEWQSTDEDDVLQKAFWSLYKKNEFNGVLKLRLGKHFLRTYASLLENKGIAEKVTN